MGGQKAHQDLRFVGSSLERKSILVEPRLNANVSGTQGIV
jgi:hypothetical protein